jgi:hypothetical protein
LTPSSTAEVNSDPAGLADGGQMLQGVDGVQLQGQLSVPPHPSGTLAQLTPSAVQVVGVHPQTLATPPPPQVAGAVQLLPQLRVPPQASGMVPQFLP